MKKELQITWLVNTFGQLVVWEGDYSKLLERGTDEDLKQLENIKPLHVITEQETINKYLSDLGHDEEEFPILCDNWGFEIMRI